MNILPRHTIAFAIAVTIGVATVIPEEADALANGRPFQELNALIQENAAAIDENGNLIEANSDAILTLSAELSLLDGRVGVLESDVSGLTTRFDAIENNVNALNSDITLILTQIRVLQDSLAEVAGEVETNSQILAEIQNSITATEQAITQLESDIQVLLATQAEHDAAISAVLSKIGVVEDQIASLDPDSEALAALQIDLAELNDSYASLIAMKETNVDRIAEAEQAIASAQAELLALQSQHQELYSVISNTAAASQQTIDALRADVNALQESYIAKKAENAAELASLQIALNQLALDNNAIASDLHDQMLALALLVDSDSTSITALHTQVSTLSGTLTLLNTHFNSLNARYIQLKSLLETQDAEVDQMLGLMPSLRIQTYEIYNTDYNAQVFTYTDRYGMPDENIVRDIREFFIANPRTRYGYVYFRMDSGDGIRTTELCIQDRAGNTFDIFNSNEDHYEVVIPNTYTTYTYARTNGGSWNTHGYSPIQLTTGKTNETDLLDIYFYYDPEKRFRVLHSNSSPDYDTHHQYRYWTLELMQDTEIMIIIDPDRITACGF